MLEKNHDILIYNKYDTLKNAFALLTQLAKDFFIDGQKDIVPQKRAFNKAICV